uniref:Uncharacterized protein n=1 Tax=Anguilla anguilla TaxID=7936 RepID=A0A0E9Q396_ANGAN
MIIFLTVQHYSPLSYRKLISPPAPDSKERNRNQDGDQQNLTRFVNSIRR